jgi:hypothetical protein
MDEKKLSSTHQESREAGLPVLLNGVCNSGHTTPKRVKKGYCSFVLLMRKTAPSNPMIKVAGRTTEGNSGILLPATHVLKALFVSRCV